MANVEPGDRIICCVKDTILVSPYSGWDEQIDLTVLALDDDSKGCFVYVPDYIYLKGTTEINRYNIKALGILPKYVGCFCLYVSFANILRICKRLEGMNCSKCTDFCYQADSNQDDGSFICFSCRVNPYR